MKGFFIMNLDFNDIIIKKEIKNGNQGVKGYLALTSNK